MMIILLYKDMREASVQGGGGITDGQRYPLPNGNLMQQSGHHPFRHPTLFSIMFKSFKGYRCLSILNYLPKFSTRTAPDYDPNQPQICHHLPK